MISNVVLDTGPLVAYLRERDKDHAWAIEQLQHIRQPLLTCEAVLTEACFLLRGEPTGIDQIGVYLREGLLAVSFEVMPQHDRVFGLMETYRNVPMSFADACLVCMAESLPEARVFTLDSDFRIYRQHNRKQIPLIIPD